MQFETVVRSSDDLVALARSFARTLKAGDVVTLTGPLGAGKTTFVRGIVLELLGADAVTSPTFTFWHEYPGNPPVRHLDLFRLEDESELTELGLHEAFDGAAVVAIEWPERAPSLIPSGARAVEIHGAGDGPRTVRLQSKPG
ncbi:MAG TPA: tRNA (adenosine(37)-N6)-threonylcarbamoyltransferase complex ATPase subunit type 1 TsaE [Candidatus Binatia bacterium]|nr:tRNA (adenosine(37)-N6)-threonylcarbamoyltransferase complex ATPase subunit type 1 TsaE [Candidatus Binatia bacterium]